VIFLLSPPSGVSLSLIHTRTEAAETNPHNINEGREKRTTAVLLVKRKGKDDIDHTAPYFLFWNYIT
jgi:hypothetical protein